MKETYTKQELIEAIKLARLAEMNNEVFEFADISGLTEVCTYDLQEAYSDAEIIVLIKAEFK